MTGDEFMAALRGEGFETFATVERDAGGSLPEHSHPFEAKALVLAGELRIACGGSERLYRAGEVFHLAAGVPHAEWFGPEGVRYLAGRK